MFSSSWGAGTRSWKDSLENSQTGGHRSTPGEAVAPPPENDTSCFFFSNLTGRTRSNKPLAEKVHVGYRVAVKAVLKQVESDHYTGLQVHTFTHTHRSSQNAVFTTSHCTPSASEVHFVRAPNRSSRREGVRALLLGPTSRLRSPQAQNPAPADSKLLRVPALSCSSLGFSEKRAEGL